ncbi:hypothetical protein TA3x_005675 [Tundrisphaera sp. TA3]|uniref:hypothetical protein n=1 Tax=Tundrisphaera sp. TA3 TaxID=3435775 RepID=UPI003EB7B1EF
MWPCPRCGAGLIVSNPHGPSTWVENCAACGHEGGGTVSFVDDEFADDDRPIFAVWVVDPGPRRPLLFRLYRNILGVSPRQAKALLAAPRVEVARGTRMEIEPRVDEFRAAGATLEVSSIE